MKIVFLILFSGAIFAAVALFRPPTSRRSFSRLEFCSSPMHWLHDVKTSADVQRALGEKLCGFEMNVMASKGGELLLAHDESDLPGALPITEFLNGQAVLPPYIWLDFKNLSFANARRVASVLRVWNLQHPTIEIFIESHSIGGLYALRREWPDVLTMYWVAWEGENTSTWRSIQLQLALFLTRPYGLSLPVAQASFFPPAYFEKFPTMLFTVRSEEELRLAAKKNPFVILVDLP